MKTLEIDVSKYFEGRTTKVVVKKLNFGEMCYIKDNAPMGIDPTTKLPKEKEGETAQMFLQIGIVSAPFISGEKATMEEVKSIDYDLGTFLVGEILKFNGISPNL